MLYVCSGREYIRYEFGDGRIMLLSHGFGQMVDSSRTTPSGWHRKNKQTSRRHGRTAKDVWQHVAMVMWEYICVLCNYSNNAWSYKMQLSFNILVYSKFKWMIITFFPYYLSGISPTSELIACHISAFLVKQELWLCNSRCCCTKIISFPFSRSHMFSLCVRELCKLWL